VSSVGKVSQSQTVAKATTVTLECALLSNEVDCTTKHACVCHVGLLNPGSA